MMPTDYCNMNCVYCFNHRRTNSEKKIMDLQTLEQVFATTIPFYESISCIWHGGEPLTVGVDFYKDAVRLQKKYNQKGIPIENSVQSNLTLMDDSFASFFIENEFRVGSSFDGLENDKTRHNTALILKGRETFLRHGGRIGFICVVQKHNIDSLIKDYEWFRENRINYTLNMYMGDPENKKDALYISPQEYADAVCRLFDHWIGDVQSSVQISFFCDLIDYMLFGEKSLCCYNSCLGKHVGVQYDGTLLNCNRDFPSKYSFGNIHDYSDIHQCFESEGFRLCVNDAFQRREYCKANCEIFDFCAGGCNSSALFAGDMTKPNDHVCTALKLIYFHVRAVLDALNLTDPNRLEASCNKAVQNRITDHYRRIG